MGKVDTAPEEKPKRRKKEEPIKEEQGSLFDNIPEVKPKISEEFTEKDKKPKEEEKIIITPAELPEKLPVPEEEEESEEEEEVKPEPKKKLSKADLKPSVQIKVAAAPDDAPRRRKKKAEPSEEEQGSLFDNIPEVKPKIRDE